MRLFVPAVIAVTAIAGLTACGSKPTEAELRAEDQKAMAEYENEMMNTPDNDAEAEQRNADIIPPAEAKLIDDYNKNPNETVDRLCDQVTKDGC